MAKKEEYIRGDHYLFPACVLDLSKIADGKFLLKFDKLFEMKAGHVVAIAIDDSHPPRIYSLCCGETDAYLQILFDLKEDGLLTPRLAKLKKGDKIFISKPYGSFMPTADVPMWWIATGTGIAPFYAMLKSGYTAQKLLHGARGAAFFYFERDFKEILKHNYIRCNSGTDSQGDFFGRVTCWLEEAEELSTNNHYYLCGRALMVVEVRDLLISKGVPYENIISEIFF